jgi:hypothetical protein
LIIFHDVLVHLNVKISWKVLYSDELVHMHEFDFIFICPSLDGKYYGTAISVCLSVRPFEFFNL